MKKVKPQKVTRPAGTCHKRKLTPCSCLYQKEREWGYRIYRWRGDTWKPVRTAASVGVAEVLARPYETVLITCLGCGNDVLREYGVEPVSPPTQGKGGS